MPTFTPEPGFLGGDTVTLHMVYPWGSEATLDVTLTWGTGDTPPPMFEIYLPVVEKGYP